jgi:pyruvate, orthophosphate dikinase
MREGLKNMGNNMQASSTAIKAQPAQKYVYLFGDGKAEGNSTMKNTLGGKGANLAEMCALGLPVPAGFTIITEMCLRYYDEGKKLPDELTSQIDEAISHIEAISGAQFGDANNPLLVSVRSGARASMPGMMDTVLNLGLNDVTVEGLAKRTQNPRFAYDSYRRFMQMYSDVVLGIEHYHFEEILEQVKIDNNYTLDTELTSDDLKNIIEEYKNCVQKQLGQPFPQDVKEQLKCSIIAVFDSWQNKRAITYRKLHDIPESWGTAVTVQAMVFGNMGETSATGVAFTRNPSTGENSIYGEYLINAQGEDVVAGIRTPQSITIAAKDADDDLPSMEESMPIVYSELCKVFQLLERHYRDMQDIEFTVQNGKLWILQTRSGKRTAPAAIKIAMDMFSEGMLNANQAIMRIEPHLLDQLLHPTLDPKAKKQVLTKGLPASPGAACGHIVFSSDEAESKAKLGEKTLLVRIETSPEDIHGMYAAEGILTARGGMTSHAAVVARGMGKPCVSGAGALHIDYAKRELRIGTHLLHEGDLLTIDGATGEVIAGQVPTIQPALSGDFAELMMLADKVRTMKIRTNADTPHDAKTARSFGAEGIGLCRTEHMFFDAERIIAMREMILAENASARKTALAKLLPMQREDFVGIFKEMAGLPVTIRLLDPPLHEFLPHTELEIKEVANAAKIDISKIKERIKALHESNPMLGHRGCRLGITYPEIYEMQVQAILEAAIIAKNETNAAILPEIMIPLIMGEPEMVHLRKLVEKVAAQVFATHGEINYLIGTMIELPRAALQAGKIANHAQFFSFGTNDLTQTTLGISRDDAGHFMGDYHKAGIIESDPFASLDVAGVGELIEIAVERGRKTKPNLKLGACGEHGGDPDSISFFQSVGLDYVSCSPYRVPIAKLASAQAAIKNKKHD